MSKATKELTKRKRASRGQGRLFKKVNGKEYPAESNIKGNYYFAYSINGKRIVQALRDEDDNPITNKAKAEEERKRILAPLAAGSKIESLKAIAAKLADAEERRAEAVENTRSKILLNHAWKHYEQHPNRPQAGVATLRQYSFQWNRFERWMSNEHPEAKKLSDVTSQIAKSYFKELQRSGVSPATVNKHIGLLKLVFSIINTRETPSGEEVLQNPFSNIKPMQHRVRGRRELTTEELRRIIDSAEGEIKLLLAIGIYTGLRLGDCATLRWDEVDLARGFIVRVPHKTASSGKVVRIPLFSTLRNMLSDILPKKQQVYVMPKMAKLYKGGADAITDKIQRLFWNAGIDCHAPETGLQIKRDENGAPKVTDSGNVALQSTGKRAVVQCGFHSLRHTFVSLCREANAPLSVVEAIVGHSNPAMTRHYSHISDEEATRAVASLPDLTVKKTSEISGTEPLPDWARELVEKLTSKNVKEIKAELLGDKKAKRAKQEQPLPKNSATSTTTSATAPSE